MLKFFLDLCGQASILVSLFTMVGLILLKKTTSEIISGTMRALLGFLMLSGGAGIVIGALDPLGIMIGHAFNVQGVIPNNEAIVAIALPRYGSQASIVMISSMILHLFIARFTPIKFIYLTGHHIFYMGLMITIILSNMGIKNISLILIATIINALAMSLSPLLTKRFMPKIVGEDNIALGQFSNITYVAAALTGQLVGKGSPSIEDIELPKELSFLKDNIVAIALIMVILYIATGLIAGADFVESNLSGGQHYMVFALIQGVTFAAGTSVIMTGIGMLINEIVPAFKGISETLVPNATPALDCPIVFPYAPNAVIVGFLASLTGGMSGLFMQVMLGTTLIIPGVVVHFFAGATAGVFGNATGGRRGCVAGAFVNGLLLAFLPLLILPILGDMGTYNTTFSDGDFIGVAVIIQTIADIFR